MSTTLIIPCEPRVVANAERIVNSIVESHDEDQLKRHNLVIITPYASDYLANEFRKLEPLFGHSLFYPLKTPCTEPYGFINTAFSTALSYLDLNYPSNEISPVVWYDEKGADRFQKDALDIIEALFYKRASVQFYGPENKLLAKAPAPGTMAPAQVEKIFPDHSFIIGSNFMKTYPHTAPYVCSLTCHSHFRPFLAEALINDKSEKLEEWNTLFIVDENPAVPAPIKASQVTVAASPKSAPVANFGKEREPIVAGADEDIQDKPLTSTISPDKAQSLHDFLTGKKNAKGKGKSKTEAETEDKKEEEELGTPSDK